MLKLFVITLPNLNYIESNKKEFNNLSQEEIITKCVNEKSKITRLEVEKILNIGNTRSKQIINKLIEDNILIKKGTGKNTYYVLK